MKTVYEVVDYSDSERYYTLGVFENLEGIVKDLQEKSLLDKPISEFCDGEYEKIIIHERNIGWDSSHTVLYEIERERRISEDGQEERWGTIVERRNYA